MESEKQARLRLVGGQRVIDDDRSDDLVEFYGSLFSRLTTEVQFTGNLTRLVGFQSCVGGKGYLHFFGIEVERIESIPEGMVAWDLTDGVRTIWKACDGQDTIISQENISWQWLDSNCERCTGEFTACLSAASTNEEMCDREFWISANAYRGLQENDVMSDEIHLVDYDPSWPQQFDAVAGWLQDHLGSDTALRVEHYGSTAVPGIPAKPIIDVLVEVPSFAEAKKQAVPLLNREAWEYWWYSDHMVFIRRDKLMGQRTHHIHMAPRGHRVWEGLVFRDYLISHPEEAVRYAALKRELSASYREDREGYTQAKTEFVQGVISRAGQHS